MVSNINGSFRGLSFTYGSEFQRITKTTMNGGKHVRFYHDGKMEHITDEGKTYWKYYIPVGKATLEIKYKQTGPIAAGNFTEVEKQYLLKDHLGSTDVIVDNDGNIVERLSFNTWGKRRNWTWNEFDEEITSSSNIGFTGHKMDDEVGLVNMNARIYDPVIGRFLSPDSKIPNTKNLQSYNRYSYVRNNPLSFTDPTGHMRKPALKLMKFSFKAAKIATVSTKSFKVNLNKNHNSSTLKTTRIVTDPGLKRNISRQIGAATVVVKFYQVAGGGLYKAVGGGDPGAAGPAGNDGGPPGSDGGGAGGVSGCGCGADGAVGPVGAGIGPSGLAGASGGVSVGDGTSNDPTSDGFGIGGNNPNGIGNIGDNSIAQGAPDGPFGTENSDTAVTGTDDDGEGKKGFDGPDNKGDDGGSESSQGDSSAPAGNPGPIGRQLIVKRFSTNIIRYTLIFGN